MTVSLNVKNTLLNKFRTQLTRSQTLFDRIVKNGMTESNGGTPTRLLQPDRRDACQFIFFEIAAAYEDFVCESFKLEVRHHFDISPKKATYIMGSVDRALTGVMGWASPRVVSQRGEHLFGKKGFFAKLHDQLNQVTYQRLSNAHKVRNRIAHGGDQSAEAYRNILHQLSVPQNSRKGLSPGRLLLEYPETANVNDKWFHRFLGAYETLANEFDSYLVLT